MIDAAPALWLPPPPAIIRPRTPELIPPSLAMLMLAKVPQAKTQEAARVPHSNLTWRGINSSAPASTHSFAAQAIGTAAADRWVLVIQSSSSGNGNSCTIGGIAATFLQSVNGCFAFAANVPTGTTATIAFDYGGPSDNCVFGYWTVNMTDATVRGQGDNLSFTNSATASVDIVASGFAIGIGVQAGVGSDSAHSIDASFVEDAETWRSASGINDNFAWFHRDNFGGGALTALSVTSTWTLTGSAVSMNLVSFQ